MIQLRSGLCLAVALISVACQEIHRERSQKVGRVERSYVDVQRLNWKGDGPRTGASSPRPLYLTECLLIGPKENAA